MAQPVGGGGEEGRVAGGDGVDATYGYTPENPIKLGKKAEGDHELFMVMAGVEALDAFIKRLRDDKGRPFKYDGKGRGPKAPDGHATSPCELTDADGKKMVLYFDFYHPKCTADAKPPKGTRFAE